MQMSLKDQRKNKVLFYLLGASLLIHLSVSFVYIDNKISFVTEKKDEKRILIKLAQLKREDQKQIVETEQSKNEKIENAKFYSNKNNKFDRETRSVRTGSFKSASKGQRNAVARKDAQKNKTAKKEKFKKLKFSDLGFKQQNHEVFKKKEKQAKQRVVRRGLKNGTSKVVGLGQSSDFLEDMPLGDFTRLNTQEYEFYGFYHRIRQKLEQFWGNNIHSQAEKIFKQGRSIASDSNLLTGLIIHLNSSGEIVEINLQSTSGVKELDDAAIKSFNQAGPFPNPPKGMLKSGRAVIEWSFVVNT